MGVLEVQARGSNDHVNVRILHVGSQAQRKAILDLRDSKNQKPEIVGSCSQDTHKQDPQYMDTFIFVPFWAL